MCATAGASAAVVDGGVRVEEGMAGRGAVAKGAELAAVGVGMAG